MSRTALALLLLACGLFATAGASTYAPSVASFSFVLDGNFSGLPLQYGEAALVVSNVTALRTFALAQLAYEFGIEFYPSPFDGFTVESAPYPGLRTLAPIFAGAPYSVVSLYDSTGAFSDDYDRATNRPLVNLNEYAATVNATVLAAYQAQGVNPVYGGRYGSVNAQRVAVGDVLAAGMYNLTQIHHGERARDQRRVVSRRWSFVSLVPGPSYALGANGAGGSFGMEAFKTYSPEYGYGLQQLYVDIGPLVNGTQAVSFRNHADFPTVYGVPDMPVISSTVAF